MNIEALEELERANAARKKADSAYADAKRKADATKDRIAKKLKVDRNIHVKASLLSNGKIAVAVWRGEHRDTIHIVDSTPID